MGNDYYLVFLGENDSSRNSKVVSRMNTFGENKSVAPNIYVLTIERKKGLKVSEIRSGLCGEEQTMLLVVRIDNISDSAWTLTKNGSEYLLNKFAEVYGKETKK